MTVQVCPVTDVHCSRGCERICRLDVNSKTPPVAVAVARLQGALGAIAAMKEKLILDTGHGCSVCRDTPVVNIPGGSGTYWLCGGCAGERLESIYSLKEYCARWVGKEISDQEMLSACAVLLSDPSE